MKNISSKFKIWLIVTLVLIVAGMTIFGIFGFNQAVDYKDSYEVSVSVGVNVNDADKTIESASKDFFADKGLSVKEVATFNEGEKFVFKFDSLSSEQIQAINTELKDTVQAKLTEKGLGSLAVTVKTSQTHAYNYKAIGAVVLALAIGAVVVFVYYLFLEKLAGALTVLCSAIISGLIYVSLSALTRVAVDPLGGTFLALSIILGGVLAGGVVSRCKELAKNVGNEKKPLVEISDMATSSSMTRFLFLSILIVVFAIVLIAIGSMMVKFAGLSLIIASASALFTAIAWSGLFWAYFKGLSKTKKYKKNTDSQAE